MLRRHLTKWSRVTIIRCHLTQCNKVIMINITHWSKVILENRIIEELLKFSVFYKTRGILCNHGVIYWTVSRTTKVRTTSGQTPLIFILILSSSIPTSLRLFWNQIFRKHIWHQYCGWWNVFDCKIRRKNI